MVQEIIHTEKKTEKKKLYFKQRFCRDYLSFKFLDIPLDLGQLIPLSVEMY